jgi:hypothetical protein
MTVALRHGLEEFIMTENQKAAEELAKELEGFEANELEEGDLEDVAGGGNYNCICGSTELEK